MSAPASRSTRSTQPLSRRRQPGRGQPRQRAGQRRRGGRQGRRATSRWPRWRRSPSRTTPTPRRRRAVARAGVAQNAAALETARINLRYTTVPAPISGRIGRSLFTVGALVSANQADPLAVIQQLDPIYVDMQQSSRRPDRAAPGAAARRCRAGQHDRAPQARGRQRLSLTPATVQFSEISVDQSTGTVTLRASFPNPQGLLLPGMFVKAVFDQAVQPNAFLVPQPAVQRDFDGSAYRLYRRPGQQGGAAQGHRRPHLRHQLDRHLRPQAGRQGDHARPGQSEAGRQGAAGAGERAAAGRSAARRRQVRGQAAAG